MIIQINNITLISCVFGLVYKLHFRLQSELKIINETKVVSKCHFIFSFCHCLIFLHLNVAMIRPRSYFAFLWGLIQKWLFYHFHYLHNHVLILSSHYWHHLIFQQSLILLFLFLSHLHLYFHLLLFIWLLTCQKLLNKC